MTPEDTLNAQIWEILQDIKEEYLITEEGKDVDFRIPNVVGVGIIPRSRRVAVLKKLQEWGAIRITIPLSNGYRIIVNKDKFDEIYDRYQKLNSPNGKIETEPTNEYFLTNNDLIESLELSLQSFIALPERGFFLGIGDYVKFIDENSGFLKVIADIDELREKDRAKLKELEPKVLADISKVEKDVMERIVMNNIDDQEVKRRVEELEMTKDGRMQSSGTKTEALYGSLELVIMSIYESGRKELVSDLIKLMPQSEAIAGYKISQYFYQYQEEVKELKNKVLKTIWGSWNELIVAYLIIHKYREHMQELTEKNEQIGQLNFYMLHQEMDNVLGISTAESRRLQFIKEDYLIHINRVHRFIVNKLKSDPHKNATHEVSRKSLKERYETLIREIREVQEANSNAMKLRYERTIDQVKQAKNLNISAVQISMPKPVPIGSTLKFYPKENIASYEGETCKLLGEQARALMGLLDENKGMPYSVEELMEKCNVRIAKQSKWFKKEKQIYDCVNSIRKKLKVETGDYFPIQKRGENWIWLQK